MPSTGSSVPHIAVLGATAETIAALPHLDGVVWVVCKQTGPDVYEFWRGDRRLAQLDFANARCDLPELIAIVGRAGDATFEALESAWTERLAAKPLIFSSTESLTPAAVMAASIEALSNKFVAERVQCGRFALDLATYRDAFDRLEYSFAALETYIVQTGIQTPRELFAYPVGSDGVDLAEDTGDSAGMMLTQLLPVNSIGVSAVAISLSSVPVQGSQKLSIALRAVETGKVVANWRLDPGETAIGWTSLALDRAIDEIALTLVLEIVWPAGAPGWRVDLGPPHPNAIMCARPQGKQPLGAPIAMRVAGSVPGMTSTPATHAIVPIGTRQSSTASVPLSAYEAVTTVGRNAPDDISLVVYDRDAEFIQVHPSGPGKVTVAQMTVTTTIPAWRLSARTHLAHERANQTDFGLLVREEGGPLPDFGQLAKDLGAQPGFSGWHSLAPLQHGTLSVLLSGAANERLTVYLLTKQKGTPEFAWARFSDLQLHSGPPSPPSPNEDGESAH
jgi:hypothetical protein